MRTEWQAITRLDRIHVKRIVAEKNKDTWHLEIRSTIELLVRGTGRRQQFHRRNFSPKS